MRKTEGVGVLVLPGQPIQEIKTFTCSHCGIPKRLTEQTRHWCDTCDALVCPVCANDQRCIPWERKMEIMEHRARFHRDVFGA